MKLMLGFVFFSSVTYTFFPDSNSFYFFPLFIIIDFSLKFIINSPLHKYVEKKHK